MQNQSNYKNVICKQCKKEFIYGDFPSRRKTPGAGECCSKKCSGLFQRNRFEVMCLICGNSFFTIPSRVDSGAGKYCSIPCKNRATSIRNKGKKRKDYRVSWGYKYLFLPNHPDCTLQGYIAEHRIVGEQIVGRRLTKKEIVHHKNKQRDDNRPENLEVMLRADHSRLHKLESLANPSKYNPK